MTGSPALSIGTHWINKEEKKDKEMERKGKLSSSNQKDNFESIICTLETVVIYSISCFFSMTFTVCG